LESRKASQEKKRLDTASLQIGLIPLARTTFDIDLAKDILARARTELDAAGFAIHGPDDLITDIEAVDQTLKDLAAIELDLVLILQTTFADSTMVAQVAHALQAPLLLWAIPEAHSGGRLRLNSLCGVNLAAHTLTRTGYPYNTIYADPCDEQVLPSVRTQALAGRALRILRNAKIGRIGEHPDGLDTCMYDAQSLKKTFGLDIIPIELSNVFQGARETDKKAVDDLLKKLDNEVADLGSLDPKATHNTLASYLTLQRLTQEQDLKGLAVRCWPEFFTDLGCAACGAMSLLSNELIPCSCEADINGTITQLILQSISQEPAFGTDIVSLDDERDALVIWHCGLAPGAMADPQEPIRGTVHSNRNLPLLFEFTLKPGPVTLARLAVSSSGYRLVIGRGEMIQGPKSFSGTSGYLRFERAAREVLNVILSEGLEHHISLTYGNHYDVLVSFARQLRIPILQLTE